MNGRQLVMGDIHGELKALEAVFKLSSFDFGNDQLIQVGDICDRGKYSYEVVELLKNCKNLILIGGNHDQWLKAYISSHIHFPDKMWIEQGGLETLDSYSRNKLYPRVHESFYAQQLPYYIDSANNCFVHGGFNRQHKIAGQDMEALAWDRDLAYEMMSASPNQKLKTADNFNHIYIGHTPTIYWNETKPITRGGVTNMDTGCGKGGLLTLMDIATGNYWQA